jgi:hypothetical protein
LQCRQPEVGDGREAAIVEVDAVAAVFGVKCIAIGAGGGSGQCGRLSLHQTNLLV